MPSEISNEVKAQLFAQESGDPFLTLVTFQNDDFVVRLVNNSKDITSRGNIFTAFPMTIRLPVDDGQTTRDFQIQMDNASLLMIENLRSVTGKVNVTIEMILASMPDVPQIAFEDLSLSSITYSSQQITATIIFDNFMSIEMTSERYMPTNFPGLF